MFPGHLGHSIEIEHAKHLSIVENNDWLPPVLVQFGFNCDKTWSSLHIEVQELIAHLLVLVDLASFNDLLF